MEDDGEDGTRQLVIHLQKDNCSVTQVSHSLCVCVGVFRCAFTCSQCTWALRLR